MHQLYLVETTCHEAYSTFNFPKGMFDIWRGRALPYASLVVVATLNRFATTTLSSLYFDITKDTLYADAPTATNRQGVVAVLHEVRA